MFAGEFWGVGRRAWHEPHDRQLDEEERRHNLQVGFQGLASGFRKGLPPSTTIGP